MDKDLKKVLKEAEAQGFTWDTTKDGHPRVYWDGVFVTTFAGTASDWRGVRNGIAAMRRYGFRWSTGW